MPWTAADADRFRAGLTPEQRSEWANIANATLESCRTDGGGEDCEARAIRAANARFQSESAPPSGKRRNVVLEFASPFPGTKVDGKWIRDAKILGHESRGKGYGYGVRGIDIAHGTARYLGKPVNFSHKAEGEERDARDLAAHIRATRVKPDGLYADIETLSTQAGRDLLAIAQEAPSAGGMSHHAAVTFNADETLVESIDEVFSVDFVVSPATTISLFESAGNQRSGDIVEKITTVAELRAAHPVLVREVEEATKRALETSADTEIRKKEHETVLREREELRKKVAAYEGREAIEAAIREVKDLPEAVARRVRSLAEGQPLTAEQARKLVVSEREYALSIAKETSRGVDGNGEGDQVVLESASDEFSNVIRGAVFRTAGLGDVLDKGRKAAGKEG